MIADDARYLDVPLARLVTRQQVVKTVAHLAHEYRHAGLHVVEIQVKRHIIPRGVKCLEIFFQLVARYDETVKLPLKPHKEHAVLPVNILVQIDYVAVIVCNKLCYLGYYTLFVGTMKQQYRGWSHLH